ncbi:MAG TPA: mismatch-specific DNA-glycosylase [Chthonomonadaceae bacterium]|nr:mismatch-specific DNA-glycosylase [Chthonomonadaceae bacterium]
MSSMENTDPAPLLPDLLAPGLDVIFVGAAPSLSAAASGHYYAGPTNRFWLLLYQAGFTPRQFRAEEDGEVLRYGIGLTGLFKHIASSANHLLPPPTETQRAHLREKLLAHAPGFVCFNGKDVYALATGRLCMDWGEQEERIGEARVYVVHSSSARADFWGRERLALYKELKELIGGWRACQRSELHS